MSFSQLKILLNTTKLFQNNFGYLNKLKYQHLCTKNLLLKQEIYKQTNSTNEENNEIEHVNDENNEIEYVNDEKNKIDHVNDENKKLPHDIQRLMLKEKIRMRKRHKFNSKQLNTEEIDSDYKFHYSFYNNDKNILQILSPQDVINISPNLDVKDNIISEDNIIEPSKENINYDLQKDEFNYDEYINSFNKLSTPLDKCEEDLSSFGPGLLPTFNFAAYVDKSELVQTYVKLGVELYKVEQNQDHMRALLTINLKDELPKYLQFFHDSGVPADYLGKIITMAPMILKEDLEDMKTRIRYLRAHDFTQASIARIVTKNPSWLTWATKHIDERLGHFQNEFYLSGPEIRFLATKQPKLITFNMKHINESTFAFLEEMGFGKSGTKIILLSKPRIWMQSIVHK
jgi:hypothetical protein